MKRSMVCIALAGWILCGCSPIKQSASTDVKISSGSAPAAVTAAFQRDHPNTMIRKVEKETYKDGTVHYAYTYIDSSGKEQEVEYSPTGQQLPPH